MPNTNEENKNTGSETGGKRVWNIIKTSWKRAWNIIKTSWEVCSGYYNRASLLSKYTAVTGLVLYLYFSAVGYVYDYVYYLHYGLDILKYERPEDFIFSIFNHGMLIIAIPLTILLTIVLLIFVRVFLEEYSQWLEDRKRPEVSYDKMPEKSVKPEGKQVPYKEQIKYWLNCWGILLKNIHRWARHRLRLIFYHLGKIIGSILQKILWAKIAILVIVAFMAPFWFVSCAAQNEVADGSENNAKGRLYTVDPNRHLDDAIHIGSTADYMIFFKNGNNNKKDNGKNNKDNAAGVSHGSPNSKESDGSNGVRNSDNQEGRGRLIWLSHISAWAKAISTWLSDLSPSMKYCLLNRCYQFDREKGFVLVVPTSNVASFDVKIKDRTVDKGTKDAPSDKVTKDQTLDNLWMPAAENRSFPESYLFISPDTQSTYSQFIPYVVVDPRKYRKPQKPQKPEIKVPLVYSLPYIKSGESELDPGHKEWLEKFYESAQAYSRENRPVRIRVRGFASNEPFKDKKGNEIPNSDIQNCRLANTRARKVKDFLENFAKNTPDETQDNGSQITQNCKRSDPISAAGMGESGSQIVCPDASSKLDGAPFTIEFDPWRTPQELDEQRLVEHRIGWGTIKPDFLNRSVHIIIEDAGKCSNRGDDEP